MQSPNASSSQTESSFSFNEGSPFSALQMPIEEPVSDLEEAVRTLSRCSRAELQQARQQHRRALTSLQNGGYHALSESTREHLLERLQTGLEALNEALNTKTNSPQTASTSEETADRESVPRPGSQETSSFRLLDLLPWNW